MRIWTAQEARIEYAKKRLPAETLDYLHGKLDDAVKKSMWGFEIPLFGSMVKDKYNIVTYLQSLGYTSSHVCNWDGSKAVVMVTL